MRKNDTKFTFRLTLHLQFELDNIAKALKISRAALVRKMIDLIINNYYNTLENER